MRAKRWLVGGLLAVAIVLGCQDDVVRPPTTGSIAVLLVFPSQDPTDTSGVTGGGTLDAVAADASATGEQGAAPGGASALDGARVTATSGATVKTITVTTATGTNFEAVLTDLPPATYTVTVEGLISGEVDYYGTTTGVAVTAGGIATATVPFSSFAVTPVDFGGPGTTMTVPVSWTAVSNAVGYVVETDRASTFPSAVKRSVSGTSTTLTASDTGTTYVRVRATNPVVPAGGRPGTTKSFRIVREASDSTDLPSGAKDLGFATVANGTLTALNIAPANDVDWFAVKVCQSDSLIANARAVRLTPVSSLNSQLDFYDPSSTTSAVASNNDSDSTDAVIRYLAAASGKHRIKVSGASNTVGHYELAVTVKAGTRNTGSVCQNNVTLAPGSAAFGAVGSTKQLTAQLMDSDGNPIAGASFTWGSSNPAAATVNSSGLVTSVANGSTTITATTAGLSASTAVTVLQIVSQVAVTPGGATISALGGTQALAAQPQDSNATAVAGKTVTWGTLNPAVATVNSGTGTVTAVTAGQATISATSDAVPGYAVITVSPPSLTPVNDWTADASGTVSSLRAVWGASDTDVFSAGNDGTILHYNGTAWSAMTSGTTQSLVGLWGSSNSNVFAVGGGGTILRYNGTAWSAMTSPNSALLWGVWGAGPGAVFAVGNAGTILRYNGASWTSMTSGTPEALHGIWGASATNVFAVGNGGAILRYNGSAWSSMSNPTTEDLWGVWGFSGTEVYAAGLNGTILKYNGTTWAAMTSGTATNLRDVWGTSGTDLYAVGDGGAVLRYNGTSWSPATSGTTALLEGVWGTQFVNSVFGVGGSGTIAHGQRLGVVASVDVTPAVATLTALGATQQLAAQALDASSNVLSGRTFAWTSRTEGVATVNASGLVTAVANGTSYVVGETAGKADSALITVAQVIETVEVSPATATIGVGGTAQLTATAKDANGNVVAGATFTWGTSDQTKVSVDGSGLVTALSGTATITATSVNGKTGTATVTASVVSVASVTVAPAGATIPVSGTQQLVATARDAGNNVLTGRAFAWSSNAPSVADVDQTGLVTGYQTGDAVITATSEGKSGTASIAVSGSVVSAVVVSPSPTTLTAIGATVQLAAEARDAGNNPVDGKTFTWVSNTPSIATVSASGLVTAAGPGTVNIIATTDGISGNGSITVAQTVATVEVVPATGQIGIGKSSQLSVVAKDANASVIASPPAASWSTLDPDIATVSPAGLVGAVGVGTTTVSATISGKSGSSNITVVAVVVATVEVTPAPTSIGEGLTVQLSAVTKDGSSNVLTGRVVSWTSSSANATVSAMGLVTGVTPGSATITATSEGKTGTSVVTVTSRTVNSVVVTPRGATVSVPGGNQQFTAEALDNVAAVIPGKTFAWSSLNTTVATVGSANGVASVLANGQVTVSASVDGKTGYGLLTAATGATPVTLWDAETSNTGSPLRSVWGTAADNVFAVGGTGGAATIRRWDGSNWGAMTTGAVELNAVWGTATNDVFAVGLGGTILRYDGSSWAGMTSNTTDALYGVWGSSPARVYAVGAAGRIVFYNGTSWTLLTNVTGQDLRGVWGAASNDAWAVGNAGTILHLVGTTWTPTTEGTEDYRAVWGTAANDVFAVTTGGTIRHWNGSAWSISGTAGAALNGIYGSSSTDVYAVGASGTITRFDGNSWIPMGSGTTDELFSSWSRTGRVLAVGAAGTIRHGYRGATALVSPSSPNFVTLETTSQLTAEARDAQNNVIAGRTFAWGSSNNAVATVDANGLVTAHLGGTAVISATTGGLAGSTTATVAQVPVTVTVTPGNPSLNALGATVQLAADVRDAGNYAIPGGSVTWQTSDATIATVSMSGGLVQAVANGSVMITATAGAASGATSVTVSQATASIAVTPAGATTTGSTQAFSAQALDANLNPIAGKTYTWSTLNSTVATVDAGTGVATPGANGQVAIKASVDGKDGYGLLTVTTAVAPAVNVWAAVNSTTSNALSGVWGPSTGDLHAVGLNGVVRHYDGSSWGSVTSASADDLYNVWGSSASDVYAVGGFGTRVLVHYNGSMWSAVSGVPAGSGEIRGVWGSSPSDVYGVGQSGSILHYDGTVWASVMSPTGNTLESVWGTSRDDVWAVGAAGTIAHFDGMSWSAVNPVGEALYAVWGTSPTNVYAVGASGRILRYTGTWSPVSSPTSEQLTTVWGTGANDVYAMGLNGAIIRFNGTDWIKTGSAPGLNLDGLFGIGAVAYAGASNGNVLNGYRGATLAVSPATQTLATLSATQQMTASVNAGAVTGVPIVWTSSDPYVATVSASGLVSAIGRGVVTITATAAGGATGTATTTVTAVRVARIDATAFGNDAATAAFPPSSSDLSGTITNVDALTFNNMTVAQLRAAYDVLLFTGYTDYNASWTTRLQPYLELGGGIIWEDPDVNLGDLLPAVTASFAGHGTFSVTAVPVLMNGITNQFVNGHITFTAWSAELTPFITSGAETAGLYGRFGTGCIVLTSPDNDWHGIRGDAGAAGNMYNLLLNEIKWTADCPLTAVAGPPATVSITPNGGTLTAYNQTLQLSAAVFDAVGNALPSATVTWGTSDGTVASVSGTGLVTAVAGNGTVTITGTSSSASGNVTVVVNQPAASVTVSPPGASITGGTQVFAAVARNGNGDVLTNKTFTWATGIPGVATVSAGTATAVGSGQTFVSASVDGQTAYGLLTVTAVPSTPVNVWSLQSTGVTGGFYGVWGTAFNNQFAVGTSGNIQRFNGSVWSAPMSVPAAVLPFTFWGGVWGSSGSDVFATGQGGVLLHYNGSTWTEMAGSRALNGFLYRVWGSAPNNVYTVGQVAAGPMLRYNGSTWSVVPGVPAGEYRGVWGNSASDVYAVGTSGSIIHYDGSTWSTVPHGIPGSPILNGVWGTGADNIWAVGDGAVIWHCTGSSCASGSGWTNASTPAVAGWLWTVTGTSANDVYAMGSNGIFRYDGGSWTQLSIPSTTQVRSMYVKAGNDPMAVGGSGRIWRGVRGAAAVNWGYSAPLASNAGASSNILFATPVVVTSKTELTKLSQLWKVPSGGPINVKMALYSDLAGSPNTLLAQTGVFSAQAAGTYEIPIVGSQFQLLPGTYWVASVYETPDSKWGLETTGGPGMKYMSLIFSSALPATFGAPTNILNYKANYYGSGFIVP